MSENLLTGEQWNYTRWLAGQPDNRCPAIFCPDNHCVTLRSKEDYQWGDFPCSRAIFSYYSICEYGKVTTWQLLLLLVVRWQPSPCTIWCALRCSVLPLLKADLVVIISLLGL